MVFQNIQGLLSVLERNYKSLEQPDFSFVSRAISSNPYGALIKNLRDLFDVKEITDSNDDVSFRYVVSRSKGQWVVELSMLGLYAILLRVSQVGHTELVTENSYTSEEKDIISLFLENQFKIFGKDELEQPIALKLDNTESENTRIYQALFSDTDTLPWKT